MASGRVQPITSGSFMTIKKRPNVVVVGGGIGGLFAANALIAHGLSVSVYEQAPSLGEVGAGVFLTPNSVRQLQRVGLGPAVEKRGARVGSESRYFRHDGTPIAPVQVTDSSRWDATFGMHRAAPSRCWPPRCRPRWCIPGTDAAVLSRPAMRPGCRSPMAQKPKATSSSPPMVSTPNFGSTLLRRRVRSFTGRSPTAV